MADTDKNNNNSSMDLALRKRSRRFCVLLAAMAFLAAGVTLVLALSYLKVPLVERRAEELELFVLPLKDDQGGEDCGCEMKEEEA